MIFAKKAAVGKTEQIRRWLFLLIITLPFAVFFLIILAAPETVLRSFPELNTMTENTQRVASSIFPGINLFRHATSTEFQEVAALATAYAFWWWLMLIVTIFYLTLLTHRRVRIELRHSHEVKQLLFFTVAALPFAMLCFFGFFGFPGDPGFAKGLTVASRSGYAVMGSVCILFSGVTIGLWPIYAVTLLDAVFKRN